MKLKIKKIIEDYYFFRPILWFYFILIGEKNLKSIKKSGPKILTDLEKSQLLQIDQWNKINGDSTLRVEYNLDVNSVVFDVGGFEGNWSAEIFARYGSQIFIFEPYPPYVSILSKRFGSNSCISIIPAGLGAKDENVTFYGGGDWSSTFERTDTLNFVLNYEVQILDILKFIEIKSISKIDLLKINIEGGEYELLERIVEGPLINSICNIQVQFHNLGEDYFVRMRRIQEKLSKTHRLTYSYEFLWENWLLK